MASNTITVKPKKKTGDVNVPRRNIVESNITQGTVLLQHPLPKYGFELKPKKSANKSNNKNTETEQNVSSDSKQINNGASNDKNETEKQTGKQKQTKSSLEAADLESRVRSELGEISDMIRPKEKPVNKVGPITTTQVPVSRLTRTVNQTSPRNLASTGTVCVTDISPAVSISQNDTPPTLTNITPPTLPNMTTPKLQSTQLNSQEILPNLSMSNLQTSSQTNTQTFLPNLTTNLQTSILPSDLNMLTHVTQEEEVTSNTGSQTNSSPIESATEGATSQLIGSLPSDSSLQDKVKHLEEEKQLLRNQLDVQLQVNQELKKLLVASVGEDLQHRVERLTRDKALLSMEIGDFSKKMVEDYEHMDKISIQADMWRSKYLACRVMSDELASSRAFYAMQYQECQMALQQLLSERHELRINLHETYRGLQLIQGAFDPLNSQSSHHPASKNILDLSRTNQHLVDSIKYRLLPSHVTSSMSNKIEVDWNDYLTPAEAHARQLMSREMRPEDFRHMAKPLPPGALSVDRFHPWQNFDNLTFNVCKRCKGDINVV